MRTDRLRPVVLALTVLSLLVVTGPLLASDTDPTQPKIAPEKNAPEAMQFELPTAMCSAEVEVRTEHDEIERLFDESVPAWCCLCGACCENNVCQYNCGQKNFCF